MPNPKIHSQIIIGMVAIAPTTTLKRQPWSGDHAEASLSAEISVPSYPASRTEEIRASRAGCASDFQTTVARFSPRSTAALATPGVDCSASVTCRAQFEQVIPWMESSVFIDAAPLANA